MTTPLATPACAQWRDGQECGSTDDVRLHIQGLSCVGCAPARDTPPTALCKGCGTYLDPAARAGHDGQPDVHDRHPGCEAGGRQLRLIKGEKR